MNRKSKMNKGRGLKGSGLSSLRKGLHKSKKKTEGRKDFYQEQVKVAKTKKCEECGTALKGIVHEVAHIFPKSTFRLIAHDPKNILFLCWSPGHSCHTQLDENTREAYSMKVASKIEEYATYLVENDIYPIHKILMQYPWLKLKTQ